MQATNLQRLNEFMERCTADAYEEQPSTIHEEITKIAVEAIIKRLPPGGTVLDVGVGYGYALRAFKQLGFDVYGITVNPLEVERFRAEGFNVQLMDQSDLDFLDGAFDLVWGRHVLEHSIAPYWTLHEFKRVMDKNGYGYFEVPDHDTAASHQANHNHYSVLPLSAWCCLVKRVGFRVLDVRRYDFMLQAGPDRYHSILCEAGG